MISFAQDWRKAHLQEQANYFSIVKQQREQYAPIKRSKKRADKKKLKQFERWAYYWNRRIHEDGSFPDPTHTYSEWQRYQQSSSISKTNAVNWSLIGPKVIPDSDADFYAGMGRINVVSFAPDNVNEIWIGSPGGGIWRSTDGGESWEVKGDPIPNLGVSDIVFDPTNSNIIYVATGDYDGSNNPSIGVLKSTDRGTTWQETGLNYTVSQTRIIAHLLIDPTNTNTIFATTDGGIYKSIDGGTTWQLKSVIKKFNDISYQAGSTTVLFATTGDETAFYTSTNNGETWAASSTGLSEEGRFDIATTANDASFIIGLSTTSMYKSTNAGASWTKITTPQELSTQEGYNQTIAIAPNNKNLIVIGGVHGWRTTDGGTTWQKYLDGYWETGQPFFYVHSDHHDLKFMPGSNETLFSANDGGLYKGNVTSSTAWQDLSSGLPITQYYKLAGTPQNANFLLAGAQDNDIGHYTGSKWINRNFGTDGVEALWNYSNSNIAWTCSQNGYLERTQDGWQTQPEVLSTPDGAEFVWPLEIDPVTSTTIYGGFDNLYKSTNSGDTWTNLNTPGNAPSIITVAPSNANTMYVSDGDGIYKTTNAGQNWTTLNTPITGLISSIAVNPTNPNEVYIAYGRYNQGNKVFSSTNGGSNWTNISGSLPNVPMHKLLYLTGGNGDIFLASDIGVFHRNNQNTDWRLYGTSLPNVICYDLEAHYGTEKLRVATFGRGVWEVSITSTALGINDFELSDALTVYPNPATAIVHLELKNGQGPTEVTLYNAIGGVVYHQKEADASMTVDVSTYSKGMYWIAMQQANKRVIKKLLIR